MHIYYREISLISTSITKLLFGSGKNNDYFEKFTHLSSVNCVKCVNLLKYLVEIERFLYL